MSTSIQRTSLTTILGRKISELAFSKGTRTRDSNGGLTLITLPGKNSENWNSCITILFLGWMSQIQDQKTYTSDQRSCSTTTNQPQTMEGRFKVQPRKSVNDSKATWAHIGSKNLGRLAPMKLTKLP